MSDSGAVTVGGNYVEDEDFVPSPTDMQKQYNTSGLGASGRIEETSAVYAVDKARTAEQILAALDPDDNSVSADKVLLPGDLDRDEAHDHISEVAQARVDKGVVIGGPTPAQEQAEEEGDHLEGLRAEGTASDAPQRQAAQSAENSNSGSVEKTPAKKAPAKKAVSSDKES